MIDLEPQAIGSYLRRQRELRDISVQDLANLTRIPLRSLERLESGHFDSDIDGFVRGFVRTVASALGLDPDDTVSRMLSEPRADESAHLVRSLRWPRALAGLAVVASLAVAAGVVQYWTADDAQRPAPAGADERVIRRDPVRALAESQTASQSGRPAAAGADRMSVDAEPIRQDDLGPRVGAASSAGAHVPSSN